jgi:hypothetical protein
MSASERERANLAAMTTSKLRFVIGIGEEGLKTWRGRKAAEIRSQLEKFKNELARRGEKMS